MLITSISMVSTIRLYTLKILVITSHRGKNSLNKYIYCFRNYSHNKIKVSVNILSTNITSISRMMCNSGCV